MQGDSYPNSLNISEKTVCKGCNSFYLNKVWHIDSKRLKSLLKDPDVNYAKCPACMKIKDNYPEGYVSLKGEFFSSHRDEIMRIVSNEEKRAMGFNPMERIIEIKNEDVSATITTTTEKLAQRIGRAINNAYNGSVKYSWSPGNRIARVTWER